MKTGTVQEALEAGLDFKEAAAVELALQSTDFLLVTWMRKSAVSLFQTLQKHGVNVFLINGDVPHAKRQQIIRDAAAMKKLGKPVGIVATIESLSAGVDGIQHVTSNGIFHSFLSVPTVMAQTVARLYRLGQKNTVQWTWLGLRDSIEEPLVHHLVSKMEAQQRVTGSMGDMRNAFVDSAAEEAETLRAMYDAL
jgi:SNF2 family DNA or RNA helicase